MGAQTVAAAQAPSTRSPHHGHLHTRYRIPPEWTQTFLTKPQPPCHFLLINKDISLEVETKKQSNKEAGHSLPVTGGSPAGVGQEESPAPPGPLEPNSIIIPLPPRIRGGLRQ